jgi:hypothetical protein
VARYYDDGRQSGTDDDDGRWRDERPTNRHVQAPPEAHRDSTDYRTPQPPTPAPNPYQRWEGQRSTDARSERMYGADQRSPYGQQNLGGPRPFGPPPARNRNWLAIGLIAGGVFLALLVVAAIAAPSGSPTGASTAAAGPPSASPTTAASAGAIPPTSAATATAAAPAAPAMAIVPNVVGIDLQTAQETLFPPLRSTSIDATGQGRHQVIDANWTVVRQEPAAGVQVLVLTDIKLYVVKAGE